MLQRCPHFDPDNFDHKTTTWFSFVTHANGIPPDKRIADKTEVVEHDPLDKDNAFKFARGEHHYFGLLYQNPEKPRYDKIIQNLIKNQESKPRSGLLDSYAI